MYTLLLGILAVLFFATLPIFSHSSSWGYGPAAGVGTMIVLLLLLPLFIRGNIIRKAAPPKARPAFLVKKIGREPLLHKNPFFRY